MVDDPFASASWGVDLCDNCRSEAVCTFDGSQHLGQCACPYRRPPLHRCSQDGAGLTPFFNPSKDCLFTFSDVQRSGGFVFPMGSLAVVPCAILKPTKVICAFVEPGGVHVVGYKLLDSLSNVVSARRRLLSIAAADFFGANSSDVHYELATLILENGDWNTTAEPCRSLVTAHRADADMGPLEIERLHSCVFWRTVARMTPGVPDTMLLSLQDFVQGAIANASNAVRVVEAAQPLLTNVFLAWTEARALVELVAPLFRRNASWHSALREGVGWVRAHESLLLPHQQHVKLAMMQTQRHGVGAGRRLLQAAPADAPVLPPTLQDGPAELAQPMRLYDGSSSPSLSRSRYPPPFEYWVDADGDGQLDAGTCPAVSIVLAEAVEAVSLLGWYYSAGYYTLPAQNRSLQQALPQLRWPTCGVRVMEEQPRAESAPAERTFAYFAIDFVRSASGFRQQSLADILACTEDSLDSTLCNLVLDAISCDMESVQLCSRHHRDLLWSALLLTLFFILCGWVLGALGLSIVKLPLLLLFMPTLLWYVYGWTPPCFPLLPTCMMAGLVRAVQTFVPRALFVPEALQRTPGCWNDQSIPARDCFRSCAADAEFNYQSLTATAAWVACELHGSACTEFESPVNIQYIFEADKFAADLSRKSAAVRRVELDYEDVDAVVAQRACFALGLALSLPYLLLFVLVLYASLALVTLPFEMLYALSQLTMHIIFFSHVSAQGNI